LPTTSFLQDSPANPAISIDHVALNVADLDASVTFYSDVLGLQEIPAAAKGRRWLSLGKGGVALHLLGGRTAPVTDNRSVHLALTSDNLDPIIERLKARKISWSDFAGTAGAVGTVRTDGVRQIFFKDPDGYWIEVNDALKPRK
jgi:lactoylglutathione lyase